MTIPLVTKGMISPRKGGLLEGEIEIEPDRWQLISLPVKYGYYNIIDNEIKRSKTVRATIYNYVVTQLETVYSDDIENLIGVVNTYIGDNNFFWNYVPGFTPEESEHNFKLIYDDGPREEIVPFWIRSKVNYNMIIKWRT